MSDKNSPLSGNIQFKEDFNSKNFTEILDLIATYFFNGHAFSGSIQVRGKPTAYGLSCTEVCKKADENITEVQQLSYSISDSEQKVVSVRLQFFSGSSHAQAYYLTATGVQQENKWIEALLLGNIKDVSQEDRDAYAAKISEKSEKEKTDLTTPEPTPLPLKTIAFELPAQLSADQLVNTLYDIFIQYMDKSKIDIRILTHKNDLLVGIEIDELRETLLNQKGNTKQLEVIFDQLPAAYLKSKFAFSKSKSGTTQCELQLNHSAILKIEQLFRQLKPSDVAPAQKQKQPEILASKSPPESVYPKNKKILFVLPPACNHSIYFWKRLEKEFEYTKHKIARSGSVFETHRTNKIIAGIKEADLVVINLTDRSADCFFVLGLCIAQNKEILLLDSGYNDIPADFGHHPHKIYAATREGVKRIANEIWRMFS